MAGFGDSIMQGYGANSPLVYVAPELGPGGYISNAGVPGENSDAIAARWLANGATACGATPCTYVWFEGGVNDLRRQVATPAQVAANMLTAVDDALAKGYTVLWSDILPSRGSEDGMTTDAVIDATRDYNARMATACATAPRSLNPRLRCIFAYAALADPAQLRPDGTLAGYLLPAYSRDGIHLSNAGSQALAAFAIEAIRD